MRLIDADTLIKNLSYLYTKNHISVDTRAKEILTTIMEQPTAYDVDKVVEKLKKELSLAKKEKEKCTGENHLQFYSTKGYAGGISYAIEVVKQGGLSDASDYVCEWRIVDRPHNLPIYNTSCGKIRLQYTTGVDIYCNGCGNKIKVKQNDN